MKHRNLTISSIVVLMAGLVFLGPGNLSKKASAIPQPIATDRYVATGGSDGANDCSVMGSPCATIQHAVSESTAGDTIHVAAGTYSEASNILNIDRTLTLLGAQAGIDARTRVASESIISNSQGTIVSASNVIVDGFTIQDSSTQSFTGYGILLNSGLLDPGFSGTQILNNIFQNNVAGLGLANSGPSPAVIKHNLFENNNLGSGAAFGTGIYTDQYVGGAVTNVLIDENKFSNNNNAGIGFSSQDTNNPDSSITITNNLFDKNGRGVYFYNTESSSVTGNTITNCTVPTDGGTSVGIGIFGAVSDLDITKNNIETGAKRGIRIGSFIDNAHPNTNVTIHLNNIFGFADAGMFVDDAAPSSLPALTGPADFATCNWWGSVTGPTHPVENPSGTGDAVKGAVVNANFSPWLLGLAPDAECGVPPAGGTITACKFYDKNANAIFDAGDLPLNGWPITINPVGSATPNLATQLTAVGCVSWADLDSSLNPYKVSEGTPTQSTWIHTTPASVSVTIVSGQTASVSFGNVCLGPGGGLTIGFWQNKNGQALITAADLCALTALNLKNADGSNFDPIPASACAGTPNTKQVNEGKKALQDWIKAANASNMANMLSAQLAGMKLNVLHGFVSGSALVFAGANPTGCTVPVNVAGFISINDLIANANAQLGACGTPCVVLSGPVRVCQEFDKNALDKANNNLNFVQGTPCNYTFP